MVFTVHRPVLPAQPTRRKILPWVLVAIGSVVLGVLGVKVVIHERTTDQQKARTLRGPIPVEVAPARVATLNEIVGGTGQAVQYTTVNITSRLQARIVELPIIVGTFVKIGGLIARFDDRVQKATVAANRAMVDSNQVKAKNYEIQLKRLVTLQERHMAADYDVETAEINSHQRDRPSRRRQQALVQSEVDLEYTVLKSPVNGIVIERPANLDEPPRLDGEIAQLGEIDNVYLNAKIAEEKIGSVHLNMTAEVSFDAYPGEVFTGSRRKNRSADQPSHSFVSPLS